MVYFSVSNGLQMLAVALALAVAIVQANVSPKNVLASDMSLINFLDGPQMTGISQSELGSVFAAANVHQRSLILRHRTAPKFVDAVVRRPWTDWYPHLAEDALDWSVQYDASLLMDTLKKADVLMDLPSQVLDKSETFFNLCRRATERILRRND
jgi:hypothetical protein